MVHPTPHAPDHHLQLTSVAHRVLVRLQVAPDLLDKAKSFNLIAAVMRKFAPNTNAQGPPKAKSNAAKTVFNFHLPDIGWVDYSDCQRPKGRDLTATGSEPGEVVLQPPTQSFAASTEGPRRSQISQQPLRTIEVHADSAQVRPSPSPPSSCMHHQWSIIQVSVV